MTDFDFEFNVAYWSERLIKMSREIDDIREKLYTLPMQPLDIEDMYRLKEYFLYMNSYQKLLARDIQIQQEIQKSKTDRWKFWKK